MDKLHHLIGLAGLKDEFVSLGETGAVIEGNQILFAHEAPGVKLGAASKKNGIKVTMSVAPKTQVKEPVHLCLGMLEKTARQLIDLKIEIGAGARVEVVGHCMFPDNGQKEHVMRGNIRVGANSFYRYLEQHLHAADGKLRVVPEANVVVAPGARFETVFELLAGRAGEVAIDYRAVGEKESTILLEAKISGSGNDVVKVKETADLVGENSRAVIKTRMAMRDRARAEVFNEMTARQAGAKGHIDCTEILHGQGKVTAFPNARVFHPQARVTHEARLGGVDNKQLETLLARGMDEKEAVELIIQGLLR